MNLPYRLSKLLPLISVLIAGSSFAQVPASSGDQISPLSLKSQLVVLDTVVTDRKGNLVTNLKRDDFTIYEDGVAQTIRDFDAPANHPAIPDKPAQDRNGNEDWGQSPLTMIVVDEMNTPFTEIAYAKQCVEKYLRAQSDKLAEPTILLWLNDAGLHAVTAFTRDRDTVLQALLKHPPSVASRLARGASIDQIASSFAALQQVALFSRGHSGKKEIIWVGRSFPGINGRNMNYADEELMSKAIHSTIDLLLASRVTLYVIDPTLSTSVALDDPGTVSDSASITPLAAPKITDPFANSFNINLFVQQTGGKYYRGMNDLDREVADSVERGEDFYTLTYVPPYRKSNSDYHSIMIRLNNPDLRAQTREGYYSTPPPDLQPAKTIAKQDDNELRFDLYEATITGMPYTGVGLHVQQCQRASDSIHSTCKLFVDSGALTFNPAGAKEETTILAVVSSLDAKGKILNHTTQQFTLGVPESQVSLIHNGNMPLEVATIVPAGTKKVRIVLRDASGRIGTADVNPDNVPALITTAPATKGSR